MNQESKVEVFGVNRDGSKVHLGAAATTPPAFKRHDIVANYFEPPNGDENDYSEANCCLWALEDYHNWLVEQGWTGPAIKVEPPNPSSSFVGRVTVGPELKPYGRQKDWLTPELLHSAPTAVFCFVKNKPGAQLEHPGGGPLTWVRSPLKNAVGVVRVDGKLHWQVAE